MARTAVLIGIMSPSSFRASQATVWLGTVSRREAPCQAIGDGLVVGWSVRSQSHETIRGPATNPCGTEPRLATTAGQRVALFYFSMSLRSDNLAQF